MSAPYRADHGSANTRTEAAQLAYTRGQLAAAIHRLRLGEDTTRAIDPTEGVVLTRLFATWSRIEDRLTAALPAPAARRFFEEEAARLVAAVEALAVVGPADTH